MINWLIDELKRRFRISTVTPLKGHCLQEGYKKTCDFRPNISACPGHVQHGRYSLRITDRKSLRHWLPDDLEWPLDAATQRPDSGGYPRMLTSFDLWQLNSTIYPSKVKTCLGMTRASRRSGPAAQSFVRPHVRCDIGRINLFGKTGSTTPRLQGRDFRGVKFFGTVYYADSVWCITNKFGMATALGRVSK